MDRAGATERDQRNTPQVNAHLDSVHAGSSCHVLIDYFVNPCRGVEHFEAEAVGNRLRCGLSKRAIQGHVATEEGRRVEETEDHI